MEDFAQPSTRRQRPVPRGPRYYRLQLRRFAAPAAVLAALGLALLSELARFDNTSTIRGIFGFLLAVLAVPLLLVVGAPLTAGSGAIFLAVIGSAVLWGACGIVAARRATREPVATWRDFWHEFVWLAGGVWSGVVVSLVISNLILGGAFL